LRTLKPILGNLRYGERENVKFADFSLYCSSITYLEAKLSIVIVEMNVVMKIYTVLLYLRATHSEKYISEYKYTTNTFTNLCTLQLYF